MFIFECEHLYGLCVFSSPFKEFARFLKEDWKFDLNSMYSMHVCMHVCMYMCVSHWWSSRARGAFAVLGAGTGFGQSWAVYFLPLDDHSMLRMTQNKTKKQNKKTMKWQEMG